MQGQLLSCHHSLAACYKTCTMWARWASKCRGAHKCMGSIRRHALRPCKMSL